MRTAIAEWSGKDAAGAWRYLRDEPFSRSLQVVIIPGFSNFYENPTLESMVIPRLAKQDPEMAWSELQQLRSDVFSKSVFMGFLNEAPSSFDFSRVARSYRELDWEDQSLFQRQGNDPPSMLVGRWMESDPDDAVAWYHRNKEEFWKAPTKSGKVFYKGPARNDLAWAVANWLARDGGNAAPWLEKKLSAGERKFVGEVLTARETAYLGLSYQGLTGESRVWMGETLQAFKVEYEKEMGIESEVMPAAVNLFIEKPARSRTGRALGKAR